MELKLTGNGLLKELIDSNYINKIKHPNHDLFLLSYTKKTAIEANWNDLTLNARGLIVDNNYNIISRPFKKFFEISQLNDDIKIPYELNHKIFEKLDGSLLISYWIGDNLFLTTKGKFDSFQSIIGNQLFKNKYAKLQSILNKNYTYIFELISPQTTNIIDYGDLEDLFLLDVIDTISNESVDIENIDYFKKPKRYETSLSLALEDYDSLPEEGYVVQFENDFRLKIKKVRFKLMYHKHQTLKRDILNCIYHSKPVEILFAGKSGYEIAKLNDLHKKAIDLSEFVEFYLNVNSTSVHKLEIIEFFKIKYKDNKKLNFFIIERLFTTGQYYSIKNPYSLTFLNPY